MNKTRHSKIGDRDTIQSSVSISTALALADCLWAIRTFFAVARGKETRTCDIDCVS